MVLRVFEAFSGIGTQRMALRNLGIEHEVVAISDIDEFAVKSYAAIHDNDKLVSNATDEEIQNYLEHRNIPLDKKGVRKVLKGKKLQEFYEACVKTNNLGDISKLDPHDIPDHDLFTYSFPCQSVSAAGKQRGFEKGSGTRSSLLWECEKVIDVKRPKYLLMENVKALVSKKFIKGFESWLELLESYGYTNYWQVLNAKDYGVPQNRERVFVVSILGEHEPYKFPEKQGLTKRLKDILEPEVAESYYLDDDRVSNLKFNFDKVYSDADLKVVANTSATGHGGGKVYHDSGVSPSVLARDASGPNQVLQVEQNDNEPQTKPIGYIPYKKNVGQHQSNTVYDENKLSPTLAASDYKNPVKVLINNGTSVTVETEEPLGTIYANASERYQRGVYQNLSRTLLSSGHDLSVVFKNLRVRKLTPKECWRLMGCTDEDFHKAEKVNSNTQLYKQAGNAIVVYVLEGIFGNLFL